MRDLDDVISGGWNDHGWGDESDDEGDGFEADYDDEIIDDHELDEDAEKAERDERLYYLGLN